MAGGKQKRTGTKAAGFIAAATGIMLAVCCWLTPCSGMDTLTQIEMDELSGKAGISIGFKTSRTNAVYSRQTFQSLCQGDGDGWGAAALGYTAGWLTLIGSGVNTGVIGFNIPGDARMTIDVGTAGTAGCYPISSVTHPSFFIPANRSFFTFSLTDVSIFLKDPVTVWISLTNDPIDDNNTGTPITGEMDMAGWIHDENLQINLNPLKTQTPMCYIWAH